MSNNAAARVREPADLDPRIARSTRALGHALVALIQERDFDDITVQQILDRAGVGRATFYAHYRNKEDALHSSYEGLFAWLETLVGRPGAAGPRLFPVAEMLAHVGESQGVLDGLRRAGRMEEFNALCAAHAARMIERRLAEWAGVEPDAGAPMPRPLVARMLAGALMEAIDWWLARPSAATPEAMDVAFHELARGALRTLHGPR